MTNTRSLLSSTALSGALAVSALVVAAGAAQAATASFNGGNSITLATQSLNSSGAIGLSQTGQTIAITGAGTDSCATGGQITITAPTGVLFASVPNVSFTGTNAAQLSATGALNSGSSSVTYTITGATANTFATGSIMTVGTNGGQGPIALTSGTTFTSAVSTARVFTVSAAACSVFAGTSTANGLLSATGVGYGTNGAGTTASVDTTAAGAGKLFVTTASNSTRVATLGQITVQATTGTIDASTGAAYTLPAGSSVTVAASGPFAAANRVYLTTASCLTTAGAALPSGAVAGTVSGSTATFSALANGSTYNLCYENNSTSVIQAGTATSPAPITATATVSTLTGSTSSITIGNLAFSGNATSLSYVTGGSAYQYFIRVTNPNTATTSVFAVVTKDDSSVFSGSVTTNLGANANALYSVTDLNTATGANLTAADRARVQILTSATTAPVVGLLFNTATGVITPSN